MPGHKGASFLGCEWADITEILGADELYCATGVIAESERMASRIFGTACTKYSCEGSSLSIRAMLYLALLYAKKEGKSQRILAARSAHKAFMCACALLDIDIEWLWDDGSSDILSCEVSADGLCACLDSMSELPCAVYITSPDYLGHIADIRALSEVCRRRGVLLLCDNAHGAYLNFTSQKRHPIALGADICCDSAHKTLPVLTGGGYLHVSRDAPEICKGGVECAMSLFASTSPSYLILQSLDMANAYLADGYEGRLAVFEEKCGMLRGALVSHGYKIVSDESLKITIDAKCFGYLGTEMSDILRTHGIECEFSDPDYIVLMLTPENTDVDLDRIRTALLSLEKRPLISERMPKMKRPVRVMSAMDAMSSVFCEVDVSESVGRILAQPGVSCPPAIPVVVCGERIDESARDVLLYYGIERCRVVADK